ncbi:tyrosine protein phosphatase [Bacillus timonensis]|nr:tyrosine protein phosphatase [Bacillus timonensis]
MKVDIHSHLLFDLDDGAATPYDTITLAKKAVELGITHVIATPHHKNGMYSNPPDTIRKRVFEVNKLLQNMNIPLKVFPGMEIKLYGDLVTDLEKENELLTLNNTKKYVLIELPQSHIPHYTEEIFFHLQLKGYIPILSHVERNKVFQKDPERLYNLVQKGALTQVTAGSIIGTFGYKVQKFTLALVRHQLVHFIASDAHNENRSFQLPLAYQFIETNFSSKLSNYFIKNSIHVLYGVEFPILDASKVERKKKWF